jgi:DNA topoisomerase-3
MTGGTLKVLMVAEKPSIAQSISEALSDGKYVKRKGRSPVCPVFEYEGVMCGQKARFKVTSVAGHVYNRDFPVKYSSWEHTDPLTLFDAETEKKEANGKMHLISH